MVFQSYALYPHLTVRRNIGYPLKLAKLGKAEIDKRVEEAAAPAPAGTGAGPPARPALRRAAPASGDGAGHRPAPPRLPHGRTPLEPRRQAARADARRDRPPATGPGGDHHLRHPRSGRGDDDGVAGRRAARRSDPAGRHAASALRAARQPVRRRLHRLTGHEPVPGPPRCRGQATSWPASAATAFPCPPTTSRCARPRDPAWGATWPSGYGPRRSRTPRSSPPPRPSESWRPGSTWWSRSAPSSSCTSISTRPWSSSTFPSATTRRRSLAPTAGAVVRLSPRSRVAPGDILKLVVDTSAIHLFDLATGATLAGSV